MIGLDDPRWGELEHAYGKANDIPAKIRALRACEVLPARWRDAPLHSLWQSLCHQGDPCTAAHAAVPHLVEVVSARPALEGETVMHLLGAIAAYGHRGPEVLPWLAPAYEEAQAKAAALVRDWLNQNPVDARKALLLLADHAALSGERLLARALMALESGEVDVECAGCGHRDMVGVGEAGLEIAPISWALRAPDREAEPTHGTYHAWAVELGQPGLARLVADQDSLFICPGCERELRVGDAIVEAHP